MLQCNVEVMQKIMTDIEIGSRLKTLRKRAGLTQERLSELIGVSSHQVQKYERGADKLSTYRLQQIASILSIPIQMLFTDSEILPASEQELLLLEMFRKIQDKEVKSSVLKILFTITKD